MAGPPGRGGRSWPPSTAASAGLGRSTDAGAGLGNLRRALGRGGGSWESWPPLGWGGVGHDSGLSHAAASVTSHARILCSNLKIESPTSLLASLQPRANITRVLRLSSTRSKCSFKCYPTARDMLPAPHRELASLRPASSARLGKMRAHPDHVSSRVVTEVSPRKLVLVLK